VRKKLKLSSDGGYRGSKKCKRGYGGACGGVWRSMRLAGVWSQAVGFVLCVWQDSGFSRHENFFTFHLLYTEMLQIFYFQYDFHR
jgi:hypothetical protein